MKLRCRSASLLGALRKASLTSSSHAALAIAMVLTAGLQLGSARADQSIVGQVIIPNDINPPGGLLGTVTVGDAANAGNLYVQGQVVRSNDLTIGLGSGSSSVDLSQSTWIVNPGFAVAVGGASDGYLAIYGNSTLSNAGNSLAIGSATAFGQVMVGVGSSLFADSIDIMRGSLQIQDGGLVDELGPNGAAVNIANGSITLLGQDSKLRTRDLQLGNAPTGLGSGTLSIGTGSSVVTSGDAIIGSSQGTGNGQGVATVDGGSWTVAGNMVLGHLTSGTQSDGSLAISQGGTVSVAGSLTLGDSPGLPPVSGHIVLGTGTLTVGGPVQLGGSSGATGILDIGGDTNAPGLPAAAPGVLNTAAIEIGDHGTGVLNFNHTSSNYIFTPALTGSGQINHYAGTTILTGNGAGFLGQTTVTGGSLIVNGSLENSAITVGVGGTIGGSGKVGALTVDGTLSPGNSPGTLTVNGNLTMGAGSTYVAEVQGAIADRVNVTGTASLAGTLRLVPLGGPYNFNSSYVLLSAAGGRSGTFGTVDTSGSFGVGVTSAVSYTSSDVLLTLTANALVSGPTPVLGPTTQNIASVASALDAATAGGADLSALFNVYNQSAAALPGAINQLSGEVHASVPAMAVSASDQFLRTMLDPTAIGRQTGPGAAAFTGTLSKGADRPAQPSIIDTPAYSVWGAAFGSTGRTDGEARIGSARRDLDDAHIAVGADLRIAPGTVAGFAVSGGSARASLSGGLGRAEADVFQAGLYGTTRIGALNLGAALAYGRLENEVKRAVPVLGSGLSSSYGANAWSGRLQASLPVYEAGGFSASPFAAIQSIHVSTPQVVESNWAGAAGAALALKGRSDRTIRTELGAQLDLAGATGATPVTGYVRAAWAYYAERDAGIGASFLSLGGSSFVAEGARAPRNSALLTAGIDVRITPAMTLGARLDGELASSSSRIGGSAKLKVSF